MMNQKTMISNKLSFIILAFVIIIFLWHSCNQKKSYNDLLDNLSGLREKEQQFTETTDKMGKKIAEQDQMILTEKEANKLLLLENTNLKKIKAQVVVKTKTQIDSVFVQFTDTVIRPSENTIVVPLGFNLHHEWYSVNGKVLLMGVLFDSLSFINKYQVTIGEKKQPGLTGFLKKRIPSVELINENPYTSVTDMRNIVIKQEPKKFWQTTGFKFGAGLLTGYLITR